MSLDVPLNCLLEGLEDHDYNTQYDAQNLRIQQNRDRVMEAEERRSMLFEDILNNLERGRTIYESGMQFKPGSSTASSTTSLTKQSIIKPWMRTEDPQPIPKTTTWPDNPSPSPVCCSKETLPPTPSEIWMASSRRQWIVPSWMIGVFVGCAPGSRTSFSGAGIWCGEESSQCSSGKARRRCSFDLDLELGWEFPYTMAVRIGETSFKGLCTWEIVSGCFAAHINE